MKLDIDKLELIRCELKQLLPDYKIYLDQYVDGSIYKNGFEITIPIEMLECLTIDEIVEQFRYLTGK